MIKKSIQSLRKVSILKYFRLMAIKLALDLTQVVYAGGKKSVVLGSGINSLLNFPNYSWNLQEVYFSFGNSCNALKAHLH